MSDNFRFSPRTNRAHEIQWRAWSAPSFAEAVSANKPVLLNLTAVWCHWCHLMDETTYSDPDLIALINENMIPIRVDADMFPHVQDRYIAGGWPTNAFLTPTGEVLWSGTYVPAEQFAQVASSVLSAWSERHAELQVEIERRRKALEAARGRHHMMGLVRREAADDVLASVMDSFDGRNGGFGTDPKFPYIDAIELMYKHGFKDDPDLIRMADQTLDGMLAGALQDEDGGFFRYAINADWTDPRREKLLISNAMMLRGYALGAQLRGRAEWLRTADDIVSWANSTLRRPDGLWNASQPVDAGLADDVLYTNYNAAWISALAEAGARLGKQQWIEQASQALDTLLETMRTADGFLHYRAGPHSDSTFLLVDAAEVCRACLEVAQANGRPELLDDARNILALAEKHLWAEDGGFWDHARPREELAALRYRDKPFDTNAELARMLNTLSLLTGQKSHRALAERILALLSPQAGRYGVAAAHFALAVEEYFEAPTRIVVVGNGSRATELRHAALRARLPQRLVLMLPDGGRIAQFNFPASGEPAAFVVDGKGASPALTGTPQLEGTLTRKG